MSKNNEFSDITIGLFFTKGTFVECIPEEKRPILGSIENRKPNKILFLNRQENRLRDDF